MSRGLADWFISMRNVRAWTVAIGLLVLLLWALAFQPPELVNRSTLSAEVLEIVAVTETLNRALVRLENGDKVKLMLSVRPPPPKKGDKVVIIVEHYADASTYYTFDNTQWLGLSR